MVLQRSLTSMKTMMNLGFHAMRRSGAEARPQARAEAARRDEEQDRIIMSQWPR
ncbi:hypothetical protein [Phreatobacter stygius]|uniref:hypothetical protein n=1 Tax=Phreatobacter stygius TaxID=1940610 RepID=UPI00147694D2|nr:hypothetical protein [Phreatobacter stygius]